MAPLVARVAAWWAHLPLHSRVLFTFAVSMTLVELVLRRVAPHSKVYAGWTRALKAVGAFWTAIILSVIYFVSVSLVSAVSRLRGHDPLDRTLRPEPTFWRPHDPNPLGVRAAVRHQF